MQNNLCFFFWLFCPFLTSVEHPLEENTVPPCMGHTVLWRSCHVHMQNCGDVVTCTEEEFSDDWCQIMAMMSYVHEFRCTCKATITQCNGLQHLPSYMTLGQEGALLANDQSLSMQARNLLHHSYCLCIISPQIRRACTHTHTPECSVPGFAGRQQAASCTCQSQSLPWAMRTARGVTTLVQFA